MEQSLRRLAGVAEVSSDYRTGIVQVRWRAGVPLDLARLKAALFTWRGGVRFGSAEVTATGTVESRGEGLALHVSGTGQWFCLRPGRQGSLPPPGKHVRVAGEANVPRRANRGCDLILKVQRSETLDE